MAQMDPYNPTEADYLHRSRVWMYQLQKIVPPKIAESENDNFTVLTLDYTLDGDEARQITRDDINIFHHRRKLTLAYLSVGEAEMYRYYFRKEWVKKSRNGLMQPVTNVAPSWLGRTNREWEDNYKVRYWDPAWQQVLISYVDKLVDIGFDGVYLDIIDAFSYWSDPVQLRMAGESCQPIPEAEAARLMIELVLRVAYHARVTRGASNFQVIPQNGEDILRYDVEGNYLMTINGIGIEDLFYDELDEVDTEETEERLANIRQIRDAGKLVLVVDYVDDGTDYIGKNKERIDSFLRKVASERFYCYVAKRDRELDQVVRTGLFW